MNKPDLSERDDREEEAASDERIDGEVLPVDANVPDDAVVVDLTEDPESQDWLVEGRRRSRRKRLSECSEEELEARTIEAREKIRKLKERRGHDFDE